jgi:hypothetical protein
MTDKELKAYYQAEVDYDTKLLEWQAKYFPSTYYRYWIYDKIARLRRGKLEIADYLKADIEIKIEATVITFLDEIVG